MTLSASTSEGYVPQLATYLHLIEDDIGSATGHTPHPSATVNSLENLPVAKSNYLNAEYNHIFTPEDYTNTSAANPNTLEAYLTASEAYILP